ncbi:MAG: enoyl-CoA hydratase/isomerase family protein [Halieaceae bacterium]|nr:enoyl-CoA hydratase/isomerase family protein [Halieaceae bacterium]
MATTFVDSWREDNIAVIQLNRPRANAITYELACQLEIALDNAIANNPGAIVVTGTGSFFSGGLDLKAVPQYSADQQRAFLSVINRVITRLYACPLPVVAAINGHAIAAGFMFALTTDYRIGPESGALFGLTEVRAGIPFPAAPMEVLKAELAPRDVRITALTAHNYSSKEARSRGVLDEVIAAKDVLTRGMEVARDFATMPPDAYSRVKFQIRRTTIDALNYLNTAKSDPMLDQWFSPGAASASGAILNGH